MRKSALIVLSGLFLLYGGQAQDVVKPGQKLTLEQCLAMALERLPAILSARASVDAGRSLVRQAESPYFPQINWSSSLGRAHIGPRTSVGVPTSSVTYNSYSAGLSLGQTIFDFGRTAAQVRIQKLGYESSVSSLEAATQQAVLGVRQAYYGLLQAVHNRDVMAEAVKQFELHLEQAKGLYDVGLAPKYDMTKAQVDLGNARVNLIKARNAVKLALGTLNDSMGITGTVDYEVEDDLTFAAYGLSFEDALDQAYKKRPDLAALVARRRAGESSVSLAKKGYFPTLAGTAAFDYSGNAFPLPQGWSLGLSLGGPIFNGFLTSAQVAEARASLKIDRANEEALRLSVFLAVQQAYLNLGQSEELVPVAELNVTAAQENFDIASASYKEGVGDPIQVADASAALVSAKIAYFAALYDCKIARAALEQAMGLR